MEKIKLSSIKPAAYNPRKISEEGFENLKKSILELGVIKPLIVNGENNTLIAGHQRTRAMQEVGITECLAFILRDVKHHDECRFNQWHNKCECEISPDAPIIKINKQLNLGINVVDPEYIEVISKGSMAAYVQHLSILILKYGEFGMPICSPDGVVEISSAYALSCRNCNIPIHVLVLEEQKIERAKFYMSKDYGKFHYDSIKRYTYIQSLAQMKRLRKTEKRVILSRLYEKLVIPYLRANKCYDARILDFGAGEYDYAKRMNNEGFNILPIDPYHREIGKIHFKHNKAQFLKVCEDLEKYGQYDIVICDSVLNSVDTIESWWDVIYTCYALLKCNGHLFISGRPSNNAVSSGRCKHAARGEITTLHFPDTDGLTANFRDGAWFFQKFDTSEQREQIVELFSNNGVLESYKYSSGYGLHLIKTKKHPLNKILPSIMREFNMLLPGGLRYGLSENIKCSISKNYNNEDYRI